jgi:hypothetical protein
MSNVNWKLKYLKRKNLPLILKIDKKDEIELNVNENIAK